MFDPKSLKWIGLVILAGLGLPLPAVAQSTQDFSLLFRTHEERGLDASQAGDVNNDGFTDALVRDSSDPASPRIYVYHGASHGLEDTSSNTLTPVSGNGKLFGVSMGSAGDVNGDGHADVIVGDSWGVDVQGQHPIHSGRAYVYAGSNQGLQNPPLWTGSAPNSEPNRYGRSVAGVGDVDGDGYDDVLVGNPMNRSITECGYATNRSPYRDDDRGGTVRLYPGSSSGPANTASWSFAFNSQKQSGACLGYKTTGLGDVNGDGYDDFAVTAPLWENSEGEIVGKLFIFYGGPGGPSQTPDVSIDHPGIDTSGSSPVGTRDDTYGFFGWSLDGGGDVNNDGYNDLLVAGRGIYQRGGDQTTDWMQTAFLFRGDSTGLSTQPTWRTSTEIDRQQGYPRSPQLSMGGDVNDDGFDDVLIPWVPTANAERWFNHIAIYSGSGSGLESSPDWSLGPGYFGSMEPLIVYRANELKGDYDGDGRADLLTYLKRTSPQGVRINALHVFNSGPNPSPQAEPASITVRKGHSEAVNLQASDPYGDPLNYAIASRPDRGTLTNFDSAQGTVTYEAPASFTGNDDFAFEATDDYARTDTATIDVTVTNGKPVFHSPPADATYDTTVDQPVSFPIDVTDPDGDLLTRRVPQYPEGANVDWDAGEFRWTPDPDQTGEHPVILEVDDGFDTVRREVTIDVQSDDGMADTGPADPDAGTDSGTTDTEVPDETKTESADTETRTSGCGCTHTGRHLPVTPLALVVGVVLLGQRRRIRQWDIVDIDRVLDGRR